MMLPEDLESNLQLALSTTDSEFAKEEKLKVNVLEL